MAQVGSAPSRVLVVEKYPSTLELVQLALEEAGYEVTSASSLPDSLALVKERHFHLVLTDLFHDGLTEIAARKPRAGHSGEESSPMLPCFRRPQVVYSLLEQKFQ